MYVLYGIVTGWLVIAFTIGTCSGVFSTAGKDRMSGYRAALAVCSAGALSNPAIIFQACPKNKESVNRVELVSRAKELASTIKNTEKKTQVEEMIGRFEQLRPDSTATDNTAVEKMLVKLLD